MGLIISYCTYKSNHFALLLVYGVAILIVNERLSNIVLSLLTSMTGLAS